MKRPRVTLKLASSLDGRIATGSGESRWITGAEARAEVHRMRAELGAVMIGSGTALADDPELTVRVGDTPARQPLRVVLDSRLRLPTRSRLIATIKHAPLLVIGATGADNAARTALEKEGAQVALVERKADGVDLDAALALLAEAGVRSILAEGGGRLAAGLIRARLVDRLEWFRAPILLGSDGKPAIESLELKRLGDAAAFRRLAVRELGPDLWESYERV